MFWTLDTYISILRRTDSTHFGNPRKKAKLWQVPISFKREKIIFAY